MTRKDRAITNLKQMCSDGRYLGSGSYAPLEVLEDFNLAIKALEQEPKMGQLTNSEWIDFLSEQFDISRTSAKEMLHVMMSVKKKDNFKKQFSGRK